MAGEFSTEHGSNYIKYAGASGAYLQVSDGTDVLKLLSSGITLNDVPFSGGGGGATGLQGATGPAGGPQGDTGVQGVTGPAGGGSGDGATGLQGVTGFQGVTGLAGLGTTGLQGVTGPAGTGGGGSGETGVQGITGTQGVPGVQGITGANGVDGAQGITGQAGVIGEQGITGLQGLAGSNGSTGSDGVQGTTGAGGLTGITYGATGLQGVTGPAGTGGGGAGTGTIGKVSKWDTTSTLSDSIITDQGTFIQVDGYAKFIAAGPNIPFRVYPSSGSASSLFDFYEVTDINNSAGINLGFSNGSGWAYDKRAAVLKSSYNGTSTPAPLGIISGEPNGAPSAWFLPDNKTTIFGGFTGPAGVTQGVQMLQGLYASHVVVAGALLGSNGATGSVSQVLTKQADGTQIWSASPGGGGVTGSGSVGTIAKWSSSTSVSDSIISESGGQIAITGTSSPLLLYRDFGSVNSGTLSGEILFAKTTSTTPNDGFGVGKYFGASLNGSPRYYGYMSGSKNGSGGQFKIEVVADSTNPSTTEICRIHLLGVSPSVHDSFALGATGERWSGLYSNVVDASGYVAVAGALLGSNGATGSATHVLTKQSDGTQIWSAPSGGGGYTVVPVSAAGYTASQTSGTIILACDSTSNNNTVYLPTASGNSATFIAKKKVGANSVIVDGFNSETLDGYTTTTLSALNESKTFVSDGTNWLVL